MGTLVHTPDPVGSTDALTPALLSDRRFRATIGILIVLFGTFGLYRSFVDQWRLDFASDWATTQAVRDGESPYGNALGEVRQRIPELRGFVTKPDEEIFPNWRPPFRFLLAFPFTLFGFRTAANLWSALDATALLLAIVLLGRHLRWKPSSTLVIGFGVFSLLSVRQDLGLGQVNGILLLLFVVTWVGLRTDRPWVAGLSLGTAIAIKVFPGLLLIPMLMRRRFDTTAVAVSSAGLLTLAGLAFIGFGWGDDFLRITLDGYSTFGNAGSNISLSARFGYLQLMFALGALLLLRHPDRASRDWFWASVPILLLTWPIIWGHYMVRAIPWALMAFGPSVPRIVVPAAVLVAPQFWPAGWVSTLALACAVVLEVLARDVPESHVIAGSTPGLHRVRETRRPQHAR